MQELKTLKEQVEYVLEKFDIARNSDKYLTWRVWVIFYNVNKVVDFQQFMKLPSEDNVKRIRAHIQNVEKRFIPTAEEIAIERGWKIDEWRKLMGYFVGDKNQAELFALKQPNQWEV